VLSHRRNCPPPPQASVAPPLDPKGWEEQHSLAGEGVGGPKSGDWIVDWKPGTLYTLWLRWEIYGVCVRVKLVYSVFGIAHQVNQHDHPDVQRNTIPINIREALLTISVCIWPTLRTSRSLTSHGVTNVDILRSLWSSEAAKRRGCAAALFGVLMSTKNGPTRTLLCTPLRVGCSAMRVWV
jgi:hypothetical protein